jgi:hypothetical protein
MIQDNCARCDRPAKYINEDFLCEDCQELINLRDKLTTANARLEEASEIISGMREIDGTEPEFEVDRKADSWLESYQSQKGVRDEVDRKANGTAQA